MCNAHAIQVENYRCDEIVAHPLVLLIGTIENCCDIKEIIVTGSDDIKSMIKDTGEFKCLVMLPNAGRNRITFSYCNVSRELYLIYNCSLSRYTVTPLYIVCDGHDGKFQSPDETANSIAHACQKITLGIELIRCLIAEKLAEHGFGRKTFKILSNCKIFRSKLTVEEARSMNEQTLWSHFSKEILFSSIGGDPYRKYVAFIGCTRFKGLGSLPYSYENIKERTEANAALGGGGLALFGSGCLYTWPAQLKDVQNAFLSKRPIDLTSFLDDSNYRKTYGGCFASTIGSVCHEIAHTFDLGHTEDGIMGKNFDFANKFFTNENKYEIIAQRELTKTNSLSRRLTKIKPKGDVFVNYLNQKQTDMIFFALNCAVTLNYHKWFNNYENAGTLQSENIIFDRTRNAVIARPFQLKLIELRDQANGLCKHYWHFVDGDVHEFEIPHQINLRLLSVFAIDDNGDILKEDFVI